MQVSSSPEPAAGVARVRDWSPDAEVDVVVTNATLQWVSGHEELLTRWAAGLPAGAWLALQVPGNTHAPSHQELREVVGVLREPEGSDGSPESPQPTLAQLPGLIEEARQAGMDLQVDLDLDDLSAVPEAVGRHAYRIVQEGLTNARKHAKDASVELELEGAPGTGLEVELRNRLAVGGTSESSDAGNGSGLVGLAERATLAGGRLEHGATNGSFRLWAWLPWPP